MLLVHVAAVARNGVIGKNGGLPWRLPGDLRHFKAVTMGKPVIMGRRTWESIGRPLPGRAMIVVSRRPPPVSLPLSLPLSLPPVLWVRSLEQALAEADRLGAQMGAEEVAVIGGAQIYAQTLSRAWRLYLTEVDAEPEGEVRYPAFDGSVWPEVSREHPEPRPGDSARYGFVVRQKVAGGFGILA